MFGGEDPFVNMFGHMRRQMDMMDRMMDSVMMDPFGMMGSRRISPFSMIDGPANRSNPHQLAHPFGGFGFGNIFGAMNQLQNQALNDPNSHVYSHSTVMTFGPDGQQRVVEHSTSKAGDVRETRRRIRDGEKEQMSIGHSIGDRTHIIEKKRDKDGKVRSQQQFINLDHDEAMDFDREYQARARNNIYGARREVPVRASIEPGLSENRHSRPTSRPTAGTSRLNAPIVTLPEEDDDIQEIPITRAPPNGNFHATGPIIREISDEEAESSVPKRRKNNTGRFFPGDE